MKKWMLLAFLFSSFLFATEVTWKESLLKAAKEARLKAYAPYSKYLVGSAILTEEGKIYSGANIENASYGMTICAERCAVFKAVSEGHLRIKAVAIVTKDGGSPCGACRQVLNEFNPNMIVITSSEDGSKVKEYYLQDMLCDSFGPLNLEKKECKR